MALVAHVLNTPLSEADEMYVEELFEWADETATIPYGLRR